MKRLLEITILFGVAASFPAARAADAGLIPPATATISELVRAETATVGHSRLDETVEQRAAYRAWKRSIVPVLASQTLDIASSYGMRELNPLLADSSGRFGAKAAGMKVGATAGILALEYWIAKKHPRAAQVMSKLNWSSSVVTGAFTAHNFAIR